MSFLVPSIVKGATELDRNQFKQSVQIPCIVLPVGEIRSSNWKEFLLILPALKNVRELEPPTKTHKRILFDPTSIKTKEDLIDKLPQIKKYIEDSFELIEIEIGYENYSIEQVIKAILPDNLMFDKRVNNGSGYSLIGHIAHFNLRDEVLPYKNIIGRSDEFHS